MTDRVLVGYNSIDWIMILENDESFSLVSKELQLLNDPVASKISPDFWLPEIADWANI